MSAVPLNFHHLHYFWSVAKDGNLTRTAERLHVAQSALSAQIRKLEEQLGEALFAREGRRLELTEAGRIAMGYADDVFATGAELVATLKEGRQHEHVLRAGAVATLSRNFQESFLRPLLGQPDVRLVLRSGSLDDLLVKLTTHDLDLVLSNRRPEREPGRAFRCRRIARQMVSLVGHRRRRGFRFPDSLRDQPLIVPGPESDIRTELDALCEQIGVPIRILAEVDDMATIRLLARDTDAIALVPSVVVRDELKRRELHEYCVVPDLFETFYAVTSERRYPHPLVRALLARDEKAILAMGRPREAGKLREAGKKQG
jgi:LysR family transcriptional activator of nhaA